jgi:hypothetical protein
VDLERKVARLVDTDRYDPRGKSLIHVEVALETQKSAELLCKRLEKRKNPNDLESKALWDGHWYTKEKSHEQFESALAMGQILFCHQKTTLLQGGAA